MHCPEYSEGAVKENSVEQLRVLTRAHARGHVDLCPVLQRSQ